MRSWTQTWEAHGRLPWSCCAKVFAQVQGVQRDLSLPAKSIEVESCRFRISCEMIRPPRNSWKWNLSKKNHGLLSSNFSILYEVFWGKHVTNLPVWHALWYLVSFTTITITITHPASGSSTMRYCKSMWSKVDNNTTALNPLQIFCGQVLQDVGWKWPSNGKTTLPD